MYLKQNNMKQKAAAEKYTAAHKRKRGLYTVVTVLACVVVLCTIYALILPAITMENTLCGIPEHTHTQDCYTQVTEDMENLTCTLREDESHTHSPLCYGTWELTCEMEEHQHTDACRQAKLTGEEQLRVEEVTARIDPLPTAQQIEEKADTLEGAGDEDGCEAYLAEVILQARTAYAQYEDMGVELQELVTNRDKLLALKYLWDAAPLAVYDTLTVFQINQYTQAVTTLVYGGSVRSILGEGMSFMYWDVMVIEESSGNLYIDQYVTAAGDKRDYRAASANGFVLLLYNTSADAAVGDAVSVSFDYKTSGAYQSGGYGTVSFSSGSSYSPKPEKDNTGKLTVVPGADTADLIEVNLYDYGVNINDKHSQDPKYPGFQQNGGTPSSGVYSTASNNFGDNITSDWVANPPNITNQGGKINETAHDYDSNGEKTPNINLPIGGDQDTLLSGALQKLLGADGYPALPDSTSLGYLFSDGEYAEKKNTANINGLFRYNEDTGYYSFNSRDNHAQFDGATNSFTLYEQLITSNFAMYPFGNFLPFNDIVHQTAQVSTIDRGYLETIASSAGYQSENGSGEQYRILSNAMRAWLTKMDEAYPSGWRAAQAINAYFNANVADKNFDFSNETALLEKLYSIDYDEPTDFFFGMDMKMTFMQPKGGKVTGKTVSGPMIFSFTGDDDVWVYVDGVLFLDLSGIHRHVGGIIDFEKGLVCYSALDPKTGDVDNENPYKVVTFESLFDAAYGAGNSYSASLVTNGEYKTFADFSVHTFDFYYMERGSGSGVCRMDFNFPVLKRNSVSVTKELSVDEENKLDLLGNPDFRFQIFKENGTELFIGANTVYDILDASGRKLDTPGMTDENGVFTLKAGQTAVFSDIPENSGSYFVRELLSPDAFAQYGTIQVDGSSQTTTENDITVGSDTFVGVNSPVKNISDGSTVFHFNNQVTFHKLGSLRITKKLETYQILLTLPQFRFRVTLDGALLPVGTSYTVGEETRTVSEAGIIALYPDETAVISNILADTRFSVEELTASAGDYYVRYTVDGTEVSPPASGVIKTDTSTAVTVTNTERGTSLEIPVQKTLELPDGKEHCYTILLEQVTDPLGQTLVESGFSESLDMAITEAPVNGVFTLNYVQAALETNPAVFYYRIVESARSDESKTVFDSSQYVVEVTVSCDSSSCSAQITSVWKDGQKTEDGKILFVNQIIHYELPETGGPGATLYTTGGLLLIGAAFLLLYNHKKRGKEDFASS